MASIADVEASGEATLVGTMMADPHTHQSKMALSLQRIDRLLRVDHCRNWAPRDHLKTQMARMVLKTFRLNIVRV
jgi:hypothetical protein